MYNQIHNQTNHANVTASSLNLQSEKSTTDRFNLLPNLPYQLNKDQMQNDCYSTDITPPTLSTTNTIVLERTNSDPNLIKSTMYAVPVSEYSLKEAAIPFSILLTPFNNRASVTMVDKAERCAGCRSFASRITKSDQNMLNCNICKTPIALTDRTILNYSSFDVIKPEVKNQAPTFVFVIDLSAGLLSRDGIRSIRECIYNENFTYLYENIAFIVLNGAITTFEIEDGNVRVVKMMGENAPLFTRNCILKTSNLQALENILEYIEKQPAGKPTLEKLYLDLLGGICKFTCAKVALFTNCVSNYNFEEYLNKHKNICLNLFTVENDDALNSLARLSFYSSGKVFKYKPNEINTRVDLQQLTCIKSVFNIKILLKVSGNIVKTDVIASTLNTTLGALHMNHMDSNTTIMYNLSLSDPSLEDKSIQAEIHYTDHDGVNKIRVLNLILDVNKNIYSKLSADATFAAFVKLKLDEDIDLDQEITKILATYRYKSKVTEEQLVLPDMYKILPVLMQSYNKMSRPDNMFAYNANIEQTLRYFYPNLISLSDYAVNPNCPSLRLSTRCISDGEVYIMENSREIWFYFTRGVDAQLAESIFVQGVNEKALQRESFRENTEEGRLCLSIVDDISNRYGYLLKMSIVFAGHPNESLIMGYMVEDALNGKESYLDYVYKTHYAIKSHLGEYK